MGHRHSLPGVKSVNVQAFCNAVAFAQVLYLCVAPEAWRHLAGWHLACFESNLLRWNPDSNQTLWLLGIIVGIVGPAHHRSLVCTLDLEQHDLRQACECAAVVAV